MARQIHLNCPTEAIGLTLMCLALVLCPTQPAVAEATAADTGLAVQRDSLNTDPDRAWTVWPDLSRAIALGALDGPDDIDEKADIIADRSDALATENRRLQKLATSWTERHASLEVQTESLEDLAEIQRGADMQRQQRLHGLRADLRLAAVRLRRLHTALGALIQEEDRIRTLLHTYQHQADTLRQREGEKR
jgi:hypothetical protein